MLGSVEEAEEVVLDVFDQVWRTASKDDRSRSRVESWLFMQARSRTLDRLRKRQRQAKVVEASTVNVPIESDTKMALPEKHALIQERRYWRIDSLVQPFLANFEAMYGFVPKRHGAITFSYGSSFTFG